MWFDFLRFKTIFELKNLTHSAIALNMTQPALSKSLKRIEDYFDCSLFERSKSGLTPNEHAEKLYQTILDMENNLNSIANTIHPPAISENRKITIGLSKVWNYIYFPKVFKNNLFLEQSTQLKILYDRSVFHYNSIKDETMDFAMARFISDPDLMKDLIFDPIFQTRHAIFCLGGEEKKDMKVVHLGYDTSISNSFTIEGKREIKAKMERKDAIIEDIFLLRELLKTGNYKTELPFDFKDFFAEHGIFEVQEKARYFSPYWCGIVYKPNNIHMDLIKDLKSSIKDILSKDS